MYFNRETDYCIRIVQCLAGAQGRLGAAAISARTGVTQRFALKILLKLVGSGIVRSYKGVKGGYELARAPKDVTLLDVITAIDGDVAVSQCLHDGFACDRADGCFFHRFFGQLSQEISDRLRGVDFEQIRHEKII